MKLPEFETLEEAKQFLRDNWTKGVTCPCCTQFVKLYKRPAHATMALTLIRMYHSDNKNKGAWFNVKQLVKGISDTGTNDFSKFRHWGLVEEAPNDTDKKTSGFWRITDEGRKFVEGKTTITKNILLFNKKSYGFMGPKIAIKEVLGEKFNYEELMNG